MTSESLSCFLVGFGDEEGIQDRATELFRTAIKIWPYPSDGS
jgi:hypothetical protein